MKLFPRKRLLSQGAFFRFASLVFAIAWGVMSVIHLAREKLDPEARKLAKRNLASFYTLQDPHLAVVLPFTEADFEHQLGNLELWEKIGNPTSSPLTRKLVDLVFYYNLSPGPEVEGFIHSPRFQRSWAYLSQHFRSFRVVYANNTLEEDIYPAGPSNMFFKLFLNDTLQTELAEYDTFYWMEWDVFPIRQGWVSKLIEECDPPDPFWIRGSIYLGRAFDDTVQYTFNHGWVSHINGNALYPAHDTDFQLFLETVVDQEPSNHFWKPFDVSIAKVFHHLPYAWQWQQRFAGRFQYSNYVLHYGFTIEDSQIKEALANNETYLIHGKRSSAGKVKYVEKFAANNSAALSKVEWTDQASLTMNVCVLIRSYSKDLEFAVLAVESVVRYLPVIEIIVVVPDEDAELFRSRHWSSLVTIVGEPKLLPNGDIQQKYTKLTADMYCKGAYIFHLDSDSVLFRPVLKKDIWWRGRPSLQYSPYKELSPAQGMWRMGTSVALQRAVEYEFSRSAAHVYPREAYALGRQFIQDTFQKTLVEFLSDKTGKNPGVQASDAEKKKLFSDFNFIGGVLFYHYNDLMTWIPTSVSERNQGVYPIIPVFICQGNGRIAVNQGPESAAKMIKLLRDGMLRSTCADIEAHVKILEGPQ